MFTVYLSSVQSTKELYIDRMKQGNNLNIWFTFSLEIIIFDDKIKTITLVSGETRIA